MRCCVALLLRLTIICLLLQFLKDLPVVGHGVLEAVMWYETHKTTFAPRSCRLSIRLATLKITCVGHNMESLKQPARGAKVRGGLSLRGQEVTAGRDKRQVSFVQLFQLECFKPALGSAAHTPTAKAKQAEPFPNLTWMMVTTAMKTGGGHRRFWWKYQRRSVSQGRIS